MSNPDIDVALSPPTSTIWTLTSDPLAIFSFFLLLSTVIVFFILLLVTSRRSAEDEWTFAQQQRIRRSANRERFDSTQSDLEVLLPLVGVYEWEPTGEENHEEEVVSRRVQFEAVEMQSFLSPKAEEDWPLPSNTALVVDCNKRLSVSQRQERELFID